MLDGAYGTNTHFSIWRSSLSKMLPSRVYRLIFDVNYMHSAAVCSTSHRHAICSHRSPCPLVGRWMRMVWRWKVQLPSAFIFYYILFNDRGSFRNEMICGGWKAMTIQREIVQMLTQFYCIQFRISSFIGRSNLISFWSVIRNDCLDLIFFFVICLFASLSLSAYVSTYRIHSNQLQSRGTRKKGCVIAF